MASKYWIYSWQFEEKRNAIDRGEDVQLDLRDNEAMSWMRSLCTVSPSPKEGAESAALLGPYGEIGDDGKWFVTVLDVLPELPED